MYSQLTTDTSFLWLLTENQQKHDMFPVSRLILAFDAICAMTYSKIMLYFSLVSPQSTRQNRSIFSLNTREDYFTDFQTVNKQEVFVFVHFSS